MADSSVFIHVGVVVILSAGLAACGAHHEPESTALLNWSADDSSRVAWLEANGDTIVNTAVRIWFPVDSIPRALVADVSDDLARAVPYLNRLIGGPFEWQRHRGTITIYLAPDHLVAHPTSSGAVFIPANSAVNGSAPYLHEISHVLLQPIDPHTPSEFADSAEAERVRSARAHWLIEGFPDYMAQETAAALSFTEGDVFEMGGLLGVDSTCAAYLADPANERVKTAIGSPGEVSELYTENRETIAPAFYTCAYSFTKYLVAATSPRFVASLFPIMAQGKVEDRIAEQTGQTVAMLRAAWLDWLHGKDD